MALIACQLKFKAGCTSVPEGCGSGHARKRGEGTGSLRLSCVCGVSLCCWRPSRVEWRHGPRRCGTPLWSNSGATLVARWRRP